MGLVIRKAAPGDAPGWLDLVKGTLGDDFPDKSLYETSWIAEQLDPANPVETWVAEVNGRLHASASFLPPATENKNPIANIGRHLNRPESFGDGSAEALLRKLGEITLARKQVAVARVLASDNRTQILYENAGYSCAGFQPFKHLHRVREGVLFYVRMSGTDLVSRLPMSDSLPQITEIAACVLRSLKISNPASVRDGVTGYPLQGELSFQDGTSDDFELWRMQAQAANPPVEISGSFNQGAGYMRSGTPVDNRSVLAQREGKFIAGIACNFDAQDRCFRLIDSFSQDDLSMGPLLNHTVKLAQQHYGAVYVEVDILVTAPRLLKAAEQLGFVPVAYLPAFYTKGTQMADVVKMVKLNMGYSLENTNFTAHAKSVADIIDHSFQDQKMGVAIINLLRALPFFEGLGDGELRKIARLFTQKLYRPGEKVFGKGDSGKEAYVIMRGLIDILLEENAKPIASIGNGQIFGELAFLDGAARTAIAQATQASILLVIQRSAFNDLVQHEPHLGMVVMRNIGIELSNRLRKANAALAAKK